MATPRRIYRIYAYVRMHAADLIDFELAAGRKPSSTLNSLRAGDRVKLLSRFVEELDELCGVLDGTHDDSYLMEATQTFYWASLYAAVSGATWEDLGYAELPRQAAAAGIGSTVELRAAATRLLEAGPDVVKPGKLFLLWHVADRLYRQITPSDNQWTIEQMLEQDLQEMKKRPYLEPVLRTVTD